MTTANAVTIATVRRVIPDGSWRCRGSVSDVGAATAAAGPSTRTGMLSRAPMKR